MPKCPHTMATFPPQPSTPDDSWRAPLLATLQNCGVPPQKKSRFSSFATYFLVSLTVIGIDRLLNYGLDEATRAGFAFGPLCHALEFLFDIFILGWLRSRFARRMAQSRAVSAETVLQKPNSPRPIFYLRSFQFDDRVSRLSFLQLFFSGIVLPNPEQKMVAGFSKIGPVIAIGRPGAELPALGAARFYVTHELWQQKVSEVAAACRF